MKALRAGEADVAVVGGVNALITPLVTVGFDEVGGVLAPDGRIKSFSQDADGYARSEGGGMLVLKRVADARRDGDDIIAVIAGSAINHDGRSNGMLAPNPDAQAEVLRKAYKDAGINPRDVDYIEAHGTGTILGDPIEADALGRVVGRGRAADKPALLGAVKSNVGHLESAAGAASLAKMALALANDKIPPSINYSGPNPYIDFDAIHLKVADTVTDWPRYSGHAITGVSGFGFGGANAHLVLREVLPTDLVEPEPEVAAEPEKAAASEANFVVRRRRPDGRVRRVHRRRLGIWSRYRCGSRCRPRARPARPDRRGQASAGGRPRGTRSPANSPLCLCRWQSRDS